MENTFVDIVKSISPNGNSWTPPGGDKTLIEKDVEFENGDKGYTFSDKFKVEISNGSKNKIISDEGGECESVFKLILSFSLFPVIILHGQ